MAKLSTMAADIVLLYANSFILFMIVDFTLYVECRVQYIVHALLPRYGLYTLLPDILPTLCAFVVLPSIINDFVRAGNLQNRLRYLCTQCTNCSRPVS